jgi:hypothetical protein
MQILIYTTSFELAIRPDIPDLFQPTRSHRFSVILIHDYWVLHCCSFLWTRREVRLVIVFIVVLRTSWGLLLTGVLVNSYSHSS